VLFVRVGREPKTPTEVEACRDVSIFYHRLYTFL
jgi:hypothetical protein